MDLNVRATKKEFLDSPGLDDSSLTQAYHFMAVVNRFFGGQTIVRNFVSRQCRRFHKQQMHILDLGSGGCDIPIATRRWGLKRNIDVRFTCLEISDFACELGLSNIKKSGLDGIEIVKTDIFDYVPEKKFDAAIGSLFFHHFINEKIVEIGTVVHSFGCTSLLVNDLSRTLLNYAACEFVGVTLERTVRHDAVTSIERGFTASELQSLLNEFSDARVIVQNRWFCRVMGIVEWD